jgi:hypothetical protein
LSEALDALHQISDLQTRKFDSPVDLLIKAVEIARPFSGALARLSPETADG